MVCLLHLLGNLNVTTLFMVFSGTYVVCEGPRIDAYMS